MKSLKKAKSNEQAKNKGNSRKSIEGQRKN